METSYTFSETPSGATMVELRNRGRPSGFVTLVAPAMAGAMKRANRKDLARLKSILEASAHDAAPEPLVDTRPG
jgi:hypothetical protein